MPIAVGCPAVVGASTMGDPEAWPGVQGTEERQPLPTHREGLWLLGAEGPRPDPQHSPFPGKGSVLKRKKSGWDEGKKSGAHIGRDGLGWQLTATGVAGTFRPLHNLEIPASLPGTRLRWAEGRPHRGDRDISGGIQGISAYAGVQIRLACRRQQPLKPSASVSGARAPSAGCSGHRAEEEPERLT